MVTGNDVFSISMENIEQEIEDYDRLIRSTINEEFSGPNTIEKALRVAMMSGFVLGLRTMAKKDPDETEKIAEEYGAIASWAIASWVVKQSRAK